jgi:hypothetical protein
MGAGLLWVYSGRFGGEVLVMCLRIGKDTRLEKQCMALGYGEIKDILMTGGFVCQYACYFLSPLGLLDDWFCFQWGMEGAHARMHCLYDMLGITK